MKRLEEKIFINKNEKNKEYELEKVPQNKRKRTLIMIFLMLGFALFSATSLIGFKVAQGEMQGGGSIQTIILTALIGVTLLTIYIGILSYIGATEGLSTHQLSKKIFGRWGIAFTSGIMIIAQLGWFGVGVMMIVLPITNIISQTTELSPEVINGLKWVFIISIGSLITLTAYFGVRSLTIISILVVPFILIVGISTIIFVIINGQNNAVNVDGQPMTMIVGVGLIFGSFVSGGTLSPDFTRWAKSGKSAVIITVISFFIGSLVMLLFGVSIYFVFDPNSADSFFVFLLSISTLIFVVGVLALIGNIWTTNDNGLYAQGMAVSSILKTKKNNNIIVLGIIGTLMAPLIFNNFITFLNILNLLIPGIGAIIIINYFFFKNDFSDTNFNITSLFSWISSFLIAVILQIFIPFILPIYVIVITIIIFSILSIVNNKNRGNNIENKKKKNEIATHHLNANPEDIGKIVIVVGDPKRAESYAHQFLKNAKLICNIRYINLWTGYYNDQKISIMAHGMGFSSMGIYIHELYEFFNVDKIIRLGSCATYDKNIKLGSIIIADKIYTYSNYGKGYGENRMALESSKSILNELKNNIVSNNKDIYYGGIYSSQWFYAPSFSGEGVKKGSIIERKINNGEIIGKEMESFVLQLIANYFKKEAITIATVIDNLATKEFSSSKNKIDTQAMGKLILDALIR